MAGEGGMRTWTILESGSLKCTWVARSLLEPERSPRPSLPYSPRPHTNTSAAPTNPLRPPVYASLCTLTTVDPLQLRWRCLPQPHTTPLQSQELLEALPECEVMCPYDTYFHAVKPATSTQLHMRQLCRLNLRQLKSTMLSLCKH